jgi:hypothetical protein
VVLHNDHGKKRENENRRDQRMIVYPG